MPHWRIGNFRQPESLSNYFEIKVATSIYWNIIHGRTPGEAEQDLEGAQIMSVLGNTLAWLLRMREQTKDAMLAAAAVKKVMTSFIRKRFLVGGFTLNRNQTPRKTKKDRKEIQSLNALLLC